MQEKNLFLSKSHFLKGLRCEKLLYLIKNHPELKEEFSQRTEELFETGLEVNSLARKLFPNGKEVPVNETINRQTHLTLSLIKDGYESIFEASFIYNDLFARTDILRKGEGGWEIYEVKSSTGVKDEHLFDVAFQYYVIRRCGLDVSKAYVIHINSEYIRWGDLEYEKLFKRVEITEIVKGKEKEIEEKIEKFRNVLKGEKSPDIEIGPHCEIYQCEFLNFCWKDIPENSIPRINAYWLDRFNLYKKGYQFLHELEANDFTGKQKEFIEAFLEKKIVVKKEKIREFLDSLWFPMAFLDFETFSLAIPPYDGLRPYQQVPFQYSLHILDSKDSNVRHSSYLAPPNTDPRKELIEKLLNDIPKDACVIVYNAKFEKGILTELAEFFSEYKDKILKIVNNIGDLMLPFKRRDYYHWQMLGSHSLKKVLPALYPELNYEEMEIKNGGMAMGAYFKMCKASEPSEIEKIRESLIKYSHTDTLAMVKILQKLWKIEEI
ncbi:MAG: DUF2779 domain-containing protein [Candidatus Aminicenantia bacterium]